MTQLEPRRVPIQQITRLEREALHDAAIRSDQQTCLRFADEIERFLSNNHFLSSAGQAFLLRGERLVQELRGFGG